MNDHPYIEFVENRLNAGETSEEIVRRIADIAKAPLCPFCNERQATLLCDFLIGFEWKGDMGICNGVPYRCKSMGDTPAMFTCDRPICEGCSTYKGAMHWRGEKDSGWWRQDYCPQCSRDEDREAMPLSKEEADEERQRMWTRSVGVLKSV